MDRIQQIVTIVSAVVGVIATATGFLIPLVKNVKLKNALASVNKIATQIQPLVVEAETFIHYTGVEKKEYVMTRINDFAIKNGIPFDADVVAAKVEEIVATTKKVNARDKDKPSLPQVGNGQA